MAVPLDGSDWFSMTGIKLLVLKGNHHAPNLWLQAYHKELCSDRCCSLWRSTICLSEYSHHTPDYSQMTASFINIDESVPKLMLMNFKIWYRIGNSSGLCPSIHRSANCCVSPAISIQWMSPKRIIAVCHTNRSFHCQLHWRISP